MRVSLKDYAGNKVTSGTTSLRLYRYRSDGTLDSYDFNDNTFKTGVLTTATVSMTHRQGNNNSVDTGVWTYALTTVTGFNPGDIVLAHINNANASPPDREREFQYGGTQDDVVVYGNISDASPAAGNFDGDSSLSSTDDFYNGSVLVFLSGTLKGLARKISDYTGSSKNFVFSGSTGAADAPFPSAPTDGTRFMIVGRMGA